MMTRSSRKLPSVQSREGFIGTRKEPFFLMVTMLAFFAFVALAMGFWQGRASMSIQALQREWRESGVPFDDITADLDYRKRTRQEGTEAWMKILELSFWGTEFPTFKEIPVVGTGIWPSLLEPMNQWPANWPPEPIVSDYLDMMQPMFELIEQSRNYPKPVYFPIRFQGFSTLPKTFGDQAQVQRVLLLECLYALYKSDSARALRALRDMQELIEAFDSSIRIVGELMNIASNNNKHQAIQHAMTQDIWTLEELEIIRTELLKPRFKPSNWRTMANMERAMISHIKLPPESHEHPVWSRMPMLATSRLKLYEMYDYIADLERVPMEQLQAAAADIEAQFLKDVKDFSVDGSSYYVSLFAPSVEAFVKAIVNEEDLLRMTRTAVSLRIYKKQNGKWPSNLDELATTGLPVNQTSTVLMWPFGYSVDGESVWLWSHPFDETTQIRKTRPSDANKNLHFNQLPRVRMQ